MNKSDMATQSTKAISHIAPICLVVNLVFIFGFFSMCEPKTNIAADILLGAAKTLIHSVDDSPFSKRPEPSLFDQTYNTLRLPFVFAVGLTGIAFSVKNNRKQPGGIHMFWIICNAFALIWSLLLVAL